MNSKNKNEGKMKFMFTKEEKQLLIGLVKLSLSSTNRMIKDLERNQKQGTITEKGKKMLKAFKKSRQNKQNLIKKLEEMN